MPTDSNRLATILFVDDEAIVRRSVAAMLHRQGFSVLVAHGGVEGLQRFAKHRDEIDLILSDIVMPHLDGFEMVKVIRRERPDLKVIFISGRRDTLPDWALGNCGFLAKPFTASELNAAITQCLTSAGRGELSYQPPGSR